MNTFSPLLIRQQEEINALKNISLELEKSIITEENAFNQMDTESFQNFLVSTSNFEGIHYHITKIIQLMP